jgi:peptidyl-prolyl cis-trans isomerase D
LTEYATEAARRQISDEITNVDDLLAGGATLEDVAKETDMKLGQLDWTAGLAEGIAAYEGFSSEAAKITADDFPTVFTLDDGGIYAMRLDELVAPAPEPLDQAHDKVVAAWERAETLKALQAQAQVIQAAVDNGASLSMQGIPVTVETHVTRDQFTEGAPADFMSEVFKLEPGKTAVISGDDKVVVAQLSAILPTDQSTPDALALRKQIDTATQQSLAQDVVDAFVRSLQVQAGISLNQTAINAVHAQFP